MPLYDYDCAACGRRFEVIHGVHAEPPAACALCGEGPVRKAFAAPAIHFKGTGWAKKERRSSSAAPKTGAAADGEGSGSSPTSTPSASQPAAATTGGEAAPSKPATAPAAAD